MAPAGRCGAATARPAPPCAVALAQLGMVSRGQGGGEQRRGAVARVVDLSSRAADAEPLEAREGWGRVGHRTAARAAKRVRTGPRGAAQPARGAPRKGHQTGNAVAPVQCDPQCRVSWSFRGLRKGHQTGNAPPRSFNAAPRPREGKDGGESER